MNKFYFDNKKECLTENEPDNSHCKIWSYKTFEEFVEDFDKLRSEGNSIVDSIGFAR